MKSNSSPEAQTFDKVLRAFEIRGINYADVLSRLRRLLAKGAAPAELLMVLRRRESHERLPEYAGVEVLLLQEIERERETANASLAPEIPDDAIADSRLENSGNEFTTGVFDAASRAAGQTQAELRTRAELRTLRDALIERDAALEQLRRALGLRDARIESLTRELESALAQSTASEQAAREAALRAAEREAALEQLRQELGSRDARIDELNGERKILETAIAARTRETAVLEAELRAARAQRVAASSRPLIGEAAARVLDVDTNHRAPRVAELPAARQPDGRRRGSTARVLGGVAALLLAGLAALYVYRASPTPTPARAAALPSPGTLIRDCPVCPEMTVLPGGRFKEGSADGYASARRVHWVAVRRPIAMSTNPVTLDDFRQFVAATGRDMHGCDTYDGEWKARSDAAWDRPGFSQTGEEPVTCVSWNDAEAYATWLSTRTAHRYRLPSASEWEYAARAGTDSPSPWAPDDRGACATANVADFTAGRRYPGWTVFPCDDGYLYTAPVGSFKPSAFGLNDMLGNVLAWTEDCWHDTYEGAPIDGSAWVDGDCSQHEIRGASWFSTPSHVRVDYRDRFPSDYRTSSLGLRLVRELAP